MNMSDTEEVRRLVEQVAAEAVERARAAPADQPGLITAEAAAKILGVSRGTLYDLAAPKGPIPCVRFGRRCIRFNQEDVEAHVRKSLHILIKVKIGGGTTSIKSSTASVSAKPNCFQKLGVATNPKPSSKPKTPGSLPLRLVSRKSAP